MRQLRRVVVGQEVHARAELDAFGPQQGLGNHQVRGRNRLPGGSEMLPDPGLVIPQSVAQGQVVQVPLMRVIDVPLRRMGWHHKESVLHSSSTILPVFGPPYQPQPYLPRLARRHTVRRLGPLPRVPQENDAYGGGQRHWYSMKRALSQIACHGYGAAGSLAFVRKPLPFRHDFCHGSAYDAYGTGETSWTGVPRVAWPRVACNC